MDINETIDEFKMFENGNKYDTEYTDLDIFTVAIKVLEKENPVKFIKDTYETVNGGFIGEVPIFRCGECKKEVNLYANYCEHCGQKIKWED